MLVRFVLGGGEERGGVEEKGGGGGVVRRGGWRVKEVMLCLLKLARKKKIGTHLLSWTWSAIWYLGWRTFVPGLE